MTLKIKNKKTTVLIVMLFCIFDCCIKSVKSQDTLFFVFDDAKKTLNLSSTPLPVGNYFMYRMEQSDFSRSLGVAVNVQKGFGYPFDNPVYGYLDVVKYAKINDVLWFDSMQCTELEVAIYNKDQESISKNRKRVFVSVRVVKAPMALNSDTNMSNAGQSSKEFPVMIVVVAIVIVIVVILLVFLLLSIKNKKKMSTKHSHSASKNNSMQVVEVVKNEQLTGLEYIEEKIGDYYFMNMNEDFADSAVHKIFLHHTAIKKMYDFFKKSLESSEQTNETGCYFVGCWEYDDAEKTKYNISVEDIVEPGDDLVPGEFSFSFGLKIGVKLNYRINELSKHTGRDYVHTVWMHSHPGLGLFLSVHDLTVQKQLAYSDAKKRLVAFVVDTNTPNLDLAVFTAKNDGTMNNKEDLRRLYSLEDLYKWSRNVFSKSGSLHEAITESVSAQVNLEDYHAVQVNHQGNTRTLNIYFNGRVINSIDDIIYNCSGKHTIGGYVTGQKNTRGDLVVDECVAIVERNEIPSNALGVLIVDADIDRTDALNHYLEGMSVSCVLVSKNEDELLILTRTNIDEPFQAFQNAAVCSMKPMKEWLRRRRIYK